MKETIVPRVGITEDRECGLMHRRRAVASVLMLGMPGIANVVDGWVQASRMRTCDQVCDVNCHTCYTWNGQPSPHELHPLEVQSNRVPVIAPDLGTIRKWRPELWHDGFVDCGIMYWHHFFKQTGPQESCHERLTSV